MTERYCRKCLSIDMKEETYFSTLRAHIAQIDDELKVSNEEYDRRLSICKQCDYLTDAMCKACGCFVEMRGILRKNVCPYDKWKTEES